MSVVLFFALATVFYLYDRLAEKTAECNNWKQQHDASSEASYLKGDHIARLLNLLASMTVAKNKALEMLRCTDDGPRTRECYNAVTGRDFDKDIAELEKVK
jgi:hypothetical protein